MHVLENMTWLGSEGRRAGMGRGRSWGEETRWREFCAQGDSGREVARNPVHLRGRWLVSLELR